MSARDPRRGARLPSPAPEALERVRLDRWLWAARFFRTRELACAAIEAGQVRVAGERVKPARTLRVGERVSIRRAGLLWEVEVLATIDRRVGAPEAARAYREDDEVRAAREAAIALRRASAPPAFPARPTKRDRRALDDFLNES